MPRQLDTLDSAAQDALDALQKDVQNMQHVCSDAREKINHILADSSNKSREYVALRKQYADLLAEHTKTCELLKQAQERLAQLEVSVAVPPEAEGAEPLYLKKFIAESLDTSKNWAPDSRRAIASLLLTMYPQFFASKELRELVRKYQSDDAAQISFHIDHLDNLFNRSTIVKGDIENR